MINVVKLLKLYDTAEPHEVLDVAPLARRVRGDFCLASQTASSGIAARASIVLRQGTPVGRFDRNLVGQSGGIPGMFLYVIIQFITLNHATNQSWAKCDCDAVVSVRRLRSNCSHSSGNGAPNRSEALFLGKDISRYYGISSHLDERAIGLGDGADYYHECSG